MLFLYRQKKKNKKNKVIRFKKKGIINYPLYEIIVTYKNLRNKSKSLEKLGFYNPHMGVKSIYINTYRLSY
jgi:ribosomal protein S16